MEKDETLKLINKSLGFGIIFGTISGTEDMGVVLRTSLIFASGVVTAWKEIYIKVKCF